MEVYALYQVLSFSQMLDGGFGWVWLVLTPSSREVGVFLAYF